MTSALIALDETLLHQAPSPFGEVVTSDHRFFDRNWFGAYARDGSVGLITGMGAYANMNVLDGFAAVHLDGKQWNVRISRALRPRIDELAVGPLRHEILRPLAAHRLVLEGGAHGVAFDLSWEGVAPPHLEPPHVTVLDGRTAQNYRRFDQIGRVAGRIEVGGRRFDAADWFAVRDHSWGIRRAVGGYEPFTGSLPVEARGMLFLWLEFATTNHWGHLQLHEDADGHTLFLEGFVASAGADASEGAPVREVRHDVSFVSGTRAYETARLEMATGDGRTWRLEAEPVFPAWVYVGTGYDGGFADGKGLGVYRGAELVEHDVYGVDHPADVRLPDGRVIRPLHREQGVRLRLDGEAGMGHLPIIPIGPLPRYGFES